MAAPDIRAAVGHSLMAAADLCGRDKVVGFFEDMGSDIRKTLVPIDPLGVADKKARELSAKKINSLLAIRNRNMDPLLIVAIVGGALLVGSFGVPKVKEYFAGKKAGADLTLDPIAALKELFSTTETKVLSATPTRAIAVSLLIHFEPVVDALPNEAAKASCHAAIKTLITEIGDPTPVAS
jgi:hypothetical protein